RFRFAKTSKVFETWSIENTIYLTFFTVTFCKILSTSSAFSIPSSGWIQLALPQAAPKRAHSLGSSCFKYARQRPASKQSPEPMVLKILDSLILYEAWINLSSNFIYRPLAPAVTAASLQYLPSH